MRERRRERQRGREGEESREYYIIEKKKELEKEKKRARVEERRRKPCQTEKERKRERERERESMGSRPSSSSFFLPPQNKQATSPSPTTPFSFPSTFSQEGCTVKNLATLTIARVGKGGKRVIRDGEGERKK